MSGPLDGMLPKARELKVELTKYDVLASVDPECAHLDAVETMTAGTRRCPCGRFETVAERHMLVYPSEGGA